MTPRFLPLVVAAVAALGAAGAQAQTVINQSKIDSWPHVISQPGHYKLTGNIVVPAAMDGFQIDADHVTLDLNGFTIAGPVTCPVQGPCSTPNFFRTGVKILGQGVSVRGGTIKGFAGHGVTMSSATRLSDLVITQNAGHGAVPESSDRRGIMMERVQVTRNGESGVICVNVTVRDSELVENGTVGLQSTVSCGVFDTTIVKNKMIGLYATGATLVRGVRLMSNGTNRGGTGIISAGGNVDHTTPF